MTEVKEVEVGGVKYKIKKWTLGDRKPLSKYFGNVSETSLDKVTDFEAEAIFYTVVEPKFNSLDDVYNLPQEVADELFYHIISFNKPKKNFLEELKNLY